MSINVGDEGTCRASLNNGGLNTLPEGAATSWSTSHPEIISINPSATNPLQCNITGVSPGTASITCAVTNGAEAGGTTVTGSLDEPCTPPPPPTVISVTVTQL